MAMVKKILTKIKQNATRVMSIALAVIMLVLSINMRPTVAAAIPYTPGAEQILIAIAGAAGISFASETDAMNFVSEIQYYDSGAAMMQQVEEVRSIMASESPHYIKQGIDAVGNVITEVSQDFTTGAKALYRMGMAEIESIFGTIAEAFDTMYSTRTAEEIDAGIISNNKIQGYIDGVIVINEPPGFSLVTSATYINAEPETSTLAQFIGQTVIATVHTRQQFDYRKAYVNVIGWSGNYLLISVVSNVSTAAQINETKPYTATLSPTNVMTDTPAAVSAVAALGGIAAGAQPGTYTEDDVIGLAIPMPGTDSLVNFQSRDVVINLDNVIDVDDIQTDPEPSVSPSPSPTPNPIKVPSIPAILDLIKIAIENMNKVKEKANETAVDDGVLDSALNNIVSDMTNIKTQLDNMPQDNPNDPNLLPYLEDAQNTILDLQNQIVDLEKTVEAEPEKYPDPALLEELQNLQNELEELKNSMGTEPGNNSTPGASPDYTNLLERILVILTEIKESIVTMPETLSETIIGSGELTLPARGGAGGNDNDNDDDDFDFTTIFPFCIPFDLAMMFERLVGTPSPPRFEAEIMGYTWVMDFSEYEYIAEVIRNGLMITFAFWLMIITSRLIKWH